jgi:hypothetical protein
MKIKLLYGTLSLIILYFLSIAAIDIDNSDEPKKTNKDVIKFSHAVHKEVSDCASCHTNIMESISLNDRLLPEKSVCANCHDVEDTNQCNYCHYEDVQEPFLIKKSELLFNHKYHLSEQKMECIACHKGLEEVAYSFESASVNPPMSNCYTCHNDRTVAANNCETCHISTVNLIPEDHLQVGFLKAHKHKALTMNNNCEMCHDNTFCESCHVSTTMITEANTARDFYTPFSPHKFVDNTKQQQITRVHDLNYRFTHGIDAKSKSANCQTCHQTETFCVECHTSSGGDYALGGMVPASHKAPNFVTIGVGTGGGGHATLARRDIERCAGCHDVQGADANCILCHVDNDGIKGTNPKTHIRGFMKSSSGGDWHNDLGSVCYSCHTDANAKPNGKKGIGFCSYCHN